MLTDQMEEPKATVELSRSGEAYDVSGNVYCGDKEQWLLGETYQQCWDHATSWLKGFGVDLDPDYEIEHERGDSSYVFHEQEAIP